MSLLLYGFAFVGLLLYSIWPKRRLAPGPPRLPIVGSLPFIDQSKHLLEQAPAWREKYGGVVQVSLGMADWLLITKVADARQLLYGTAVEDRPRLMLYHDEIHPERWLGPAAKADEWILATRRVTGQLVRTVGDHGGEHAAKMMLEWLEFHLKEQPDFERTLWHFAVANALESAYGIQLESASQAAEFDELQDLIDTGRHMMTAFDPQSEPTVFFPFVEHLNPSRTRTIKARGAAMYAEWETRAKRLGGKVREMGKNAKASQFDLAGRDKEYSMTEDELDYQGALLLVGTLDTVYHTSVLAAACFAYLGDAQQQIREEVDALSAQGAPASQSPKLVAFLRETLRLYPFAATGFPRQTSKPLPLPGRSDKVLPVGTVLVPLTMTLARDQEYWGPDAEEHNYRRFMEDDTLKAQPFPVFGYGYGRRACPGYRLAEVMMANAIGGLLSRYELSFEGRDSGETDATATLDETLRIKLRGNVFMMDLPRCRTTRRRDCPM
ncbi:cytochrome P450 [Jaminaea rosea]|uniref:Cytochrome P450 n=1 Tax=Jaminaea rosea TaxID=1569628 RepID=A0A316UX08_9BASI|nr:cytochrome P450 [Jaminaea rosea]PWN27655.1 cytochrome P450 [Jaminaea rosea]